MNQPTHLLAAALMAAAGIVQAEVLVENARLRLLLGDDAIAKSLVLKATGEELLDASEPTAFCSVTQDRPYNNEIKLAHPNRRTTYPANRVRREGGRLVVGFDTAPYEAVISLKETDDYVTFALEDFVLNERSYPLCPTETTPLDFTAPPVEEFRLLQLPVRKRMNFGEWMNVMWDGQAAVGAFAAGPEALVCADERQGCRLMGADAKRAVRLRGTGVALVVDAGGDSVLDRMAALERDCGLPSGVANRRNPLSNASVYFALGVTPTTIGEHVRLAKSGGFRLMQMSYGEFFGQRGDFEFNRNWPGGLGDVRKALDEVRAAGIVPGFHVLHTFLGLSSKYVRGGADRRMLLREHYTLARAIGPDDTEIFVDENPQNAERSAKCRLLKFGRELMSYEGFTTERPYRFYGVRRGHGGTPPAPHEEGLIGGTPWVCEYGGIAYYLKQDSDLQDIIADRVAELWSAGMGFIYFDGSEGVPPPFDYNVPNAQYRVWKRLVPEPFLGEGAAKAHFGWHMLSGANAFDVFLPEEFKRSIDAYPAAEAPLMRRDFTRVNFGWWQFWEPGANVRGKRTIGVQPDIWEYGTAQAAGWDSPVSVQVSLENVRRHPHAADLFEVMRRWEDVRTKGWLTEEAKARLRVPGDEYHLLVDEKGDYELVKLTPFEAPPEIRAFAFERLGGRYVVFSHVSDEGEWELDVPPVPCMRLFDAFGGKDIPFVRRNRSVVLPAGARRYFRIR